MYMRDFLKVLGGGTQSLHNILASGDQLSVNRLTALIQSQKPHLTRLGNNTINRLPIEVKSGCSG